MKQCILAFTIMFVVLFSLQSNGQEAIRQESCSDSMISREADSIKQALYQQGFIILKEVSMTMESQYEMPIVVPLNQGTWYHVVFIGDITSKLYEVKMFDWQEKLVADEKKNWGIIDGNIVSYSYIPQFSEYHMIKVLQVNKKKKEPCGYIMLFKKVKE